MESFAQLAPAIILFPAIGAFINFFWGARLGERNSAIIGTFASGMTFVIAFSLLLYLSNNGFRPAVINPPIFGSWISIDSINFDISWQTRVDTLSVTMMMFVTFVGTLIHIYAIGYMHGDPLFSRFFAYLNLFLTFMLILITGNNFLMMFVGWEGVGLCSYLLIGFWWDKPDGVGWNNSNAARKAFIANRIGDFGVLMAIFLIFWTFGTLDFYKPAETAVDYASVGHHGDEDHATEGEGTHEEGVAAEEGETAGEEAHGEEESHGEVAVPLYYYGTAGVELSQLGAFGQAEVLMVEYKSANEVVEAAEAVLADAQTEDDRAAAELGVDEAEAVAQDLRPNFDIGPFNLNIQTMLVLITLFMLLGATGKSAQIPLFVWLPDAMAGPTPVSALIHAATMVTAGVYMMVRSNAFFYHAELTSFLVTIVGATTAVVAGFIAIGQFDIKRVLAYSTVSQLGFMVAAVGIGAYPAAMFHMVTHAFFKALLFLGSGSVIHGMEHGHHHLHEHGHDDHGDHHDEHEEEFDPQDMRNMGGLRKKMPITYWTYLFGTLALAGIWPFAGFWSKDEILADSWLVGFADGELRGYIALGMLFIAAGFTAFYMWRQIEMVFHGEARHEAAKHAHESPPSMTIPLMILGFFSLTIGFINIPTPLSSIFSFFLSGLVGEHSLANFLEYSITHFHIPDFQPVIAIAALSMGLGAIFFARSIYGGTKAINKDGKDPLQASPSTGQVWALANKRMYWDEIYWAILINPFIRIGKFLANVIDWEFFHDYFHDKVLHRGFVTVGNLLSKPFDIGIIDGAVNGVGWVVGRISGGMRRVQTGYVRTYALALLLGVVIVIVLMLLPMIQN
ncbi:MAG: proton-conducting transporter membrane subunit [Aggregatilineales bacterium]